MSHDKAFIQEAKNEAEECLGRSTTDADEAFPKHCEELNIPTDYSNATLDFLQRLSRKDKPE